MVFFLSHKKLHRTIQKKSYLSLCFDAISITRHFYLLKILLFYDEKYQWGQNRVLKPFVNYDNLEFKLLARITLLLFAKWYKFQADLVSWFIQVIMTQLDFFVCQESCFLACWMIVRKPMFWHAHIVEGAKALVCN